MNFLGEKKLLAVFLFLFALSFTSAANIGVSPASFQFSNVMRSGHAEGNFVVISDSKSPVSVELQPYGNISSWFNLSNTSFSIVGGEKKVKISVNPPSDVPNGNYVGYVKITTVSNSSSEQGYAVGKIKSSIDLKISVSITDVQSISCVANNFSINSIELGDKIVLGMDIKNNGNVMISPDVFADVYDNNQIDTIKSLFFPERLKILVYILLQRKKELTL
jgi:hypothetical protein